MKHTLATSTYRAAIALLLAAAAPLARAQEAEEPAAEAAEPAAAEQRPAVRRPENPPIEKGLAFVNLARIFKDSEHIAARRREISAEFRDREQAIADKIDALQLARQTLDKERLTLTNAQIQEENDRINASEVEIQRETRDLADDKRLRFDAAQRELERAVLETIKEVSRGRENFIVFDLSTILFADARLEITDDVIRLLDENMAAAEQAPAETPAE